MNEETRCEAIRPRLSARHDAALGPAEAARVDAHLEACASCREELAALTAVAALVGEAAVDAGPDLEARVARALAARRASRDAWAARGRLARRLSLYAAAVLVAVLIGLGPTVLRVTRPSQGSVSDDQLLYLALVDNGSGTQEVSP